MRGHVFISCALIAFASSAPLQMRVDDIVERDSHIGKIGVVNIALEKREEYV